MAPMMANANTDGEERAKGVRLETCG